MCGAIEILQHVSETTRRISRNSARAALPPTWISAAPIRIWILDPMFAAIVAGLTSANSVGRHIFPGSALRPVSADGSRSSRSARVLCTRFAPSGRCSCTTVPSQPIPPDDCYVLPPVVLHSFCISNSIRYLKRPLDILRLRIIFFYCLRLHPCCKDAVAVDALT